MCPPIISSSLSPDASDLLASHAVWRASELGSHATPSISTGYSLLDRELPGGGWPTSMLIELLWGQQGSGEFRLLAPALSSLSSRGKSLMLLAPPHVMFAPGLVQMGLDVDQLLVVRVDKPADRLWAAEQILRNGNVGALLCWLPQARPEHLRRLQVAASTGQSLAFIFRPAAVRAESSPAPVRLLCHPHERGQLSVDIFKRKGPALALPLLLSTALPAAIERARPRISFPIPSLVELPHVVDRSLSAAIAVRSGISSLA